MRRTGAIGLAAALAVGLAAGPRPARAERPRPSGTSLLPAIQVDQRCYVNTEDPATIHVAGSGWIPGDRVKLTGAGRSVTTTVATDGSFKTSVPAQKGDFGLRAANQKLTATESDATTGLPVPGGTAHTGYQLTNLAYSVSPQDAPFTRKITFRFSGFRGGREIFAHYLAGKRIAARERFGRASGACGMLKSRALQYPGGHPGSKRYTVQFDDAQHYSKRTSPRLVTTLSVIRY